MADKDDPFMVLSDSAAPRTGFPTSYKAWTCVQHDLSKFVGQKVTIWFIASDCKPGPDIGYAYIDGLLDSENVNPFFTLPTAACVNSSSPIILDGRKTEREKNTVLTVQECDPNGQVIAGSTAVSSTYLNQPFGVLDLRLWYNITKLKKFKCGTFYKVTLTASNDCGSSGAFSKVIYMDCATAVAGPDKTICCNNNLGTQIGGPVVGDGYNYVWTSNPTYTGQFVGSGPYTVNPTTSTTFTVKATDSFGCVAVDEVDVYVNGGFLNNATNGIAMKFDMPCPGDCKIDKMNRPNSCVPQLTANPIFANCNRGIDSQIWQEKKAAKSTYLWNTGETTRTINTRAGVMNYTLTVKDPCGWTYTAQYTIPYPADYYTKAIPSLNVPNALNPDYPEKWFRVYDANDYGDAPAFLQAPAYHAYRYRLMVFSRWDSQFSLADNMRNLIYCGANCNTDGTPLKQGEIMWDGRSAQGNIVQQGVYPYILTLWNCTTADYGKSQHIYHTGIYKRECAKWGFNLAHFMGTGQTKFCQKLSGNIILDHIETTTTQVGSITVIR